MTKVGISGLTTYLPPYRVDLRSWCDWTGNNWDKVSNVVGAGFRMAGPDQSVYTVAATAALRLIDRYDIDPRRVRFLGLGTESSTDNSAGAVIIRGMVDAALRERGGPELARSCEVPEFKHACLGGIYAMKAALRLLALEPADSVAIVISADFAKYALGSSGEPTQGAGAVAMLLEQNPQMLEVDIGACGSASAYRAVDFRKPLVADRVCATALKDTPVFNGKYSTSCYLDETMHALRDMDNRLGERQKDFFARLRAVFMHRPYQRMPMNAWAFNYLVRLGQSAAGQAEFAEYCDAAGLATTAVVSEMVAEPNLLDMALTGAMDTDPYPLTMQLIKSFRKHPRYSEAVDGRMEIGSAGMRELGNIYSASLPAWIAAGLDEAAQTNMDLAGATVLAIGYGSGDAAEALPMRVAQNWREAARKIRFTDCLTKAHNLSQEQYELLHATGTATGLDPVGADVFLVDRVGTTDGPDFADDGIEYYRYVAAENESGSVEFGLRAVGVN